MGTIQIDGSTPKLTIGNATAEDATILFDGNAQDFYIALDDSADDLLIGLGSTVGTTPIISIDENKKSTFSGAVTVGVDDTGHDVKLFGASAGAYMEWDESADQLRIMGASADATTSTGKLLLATSLTDINANDVIGKIDFQAPHEAGGTDAIAIAASIQALAQATFSSSVNATDLIFYTGHSEAATEKFRFTSQGEIGVGGANYGTDGQVLTSGGAGAAPAWEDAAGGADPPSADGDTLGTASLEWSDLYLADGSVVYFGNDQEIKVTHVADTGLAFKHTATADDKPIVLTLQTGETDMAANDVIGKIAFQAPDEGTGTDAILVSAAIQAVAEGNHAADSNATELQFMTAVSEVASTKMKLYSDGNLHCVAGNAIVSVGATKTGGYLRGTTNVDIGIVGYGGAGLIQSNSSQTLWHNGNNFYPNPDDDIDLGHESFRFDNIYATNGTIQTSDETKKENIADSTLGLDFLNNLRPRQFKFKDYVVPERLYHATDVLPEGKNVGDVWRAAKTKTHTRTHYGLIAQEVEQTLSDLGISTTDFAPFVKSANQAPDIDDLNIFKPTGTYTYSVRYTELIGILIQGIKDLSTEVNSLKARVTTLEG